MRKYFLIAVFTSMLANTAQAGENNRASTVDLLYLGISRPILIRLDVNVDNQPAEKMLRGFIQKWINFLDRNGDGALNAKELKLMPNAQEFQQLVTSGFYNAQGNKPLTMDEFGRQEEDSVTASELLSYYRRSGLDVLQVVGGNAQGGTSTSGVDRLFEVLDSNKDGKLSREEIEQAPKFLANLDANDDEYLDLQELGQTRTVGRFPINRPISRPLPGGQRQNSLPDAFTMIPKGSPTQFSLLLLSRYDKNKDTKISRVESGLSKLDFDRMDRNRDNQLDVTELIGMVRNTTTVPITFQLGKVRGKEPMVGLARANSRPKEMQIQAAGDDTLNMTTGDAKITVRGEDHSSQKSMMMGNSTARQILRQQYNLANPKNKAFLTIADINGGRFQYLVNLFPILDRNRDGRITPKELDAFADLQAEARNYQLTLQVSEDGRGLFQLLDLDRDNKLSPRELLSAWKSLEMQDRNKDGALTASEFAQQFAITLKRGQPSNPGQVNLASMGQEPELGKGTGPAWFQRMDVNGDGDVSRREFLGTRTDFDRIDRNHDGLIDAQEANQITSNTQESKK